MPDAQNFQSNMHPRRRGTVLIYLVILLPIIFGVLAILLDRGAATYTQRTMQSAADTAAVEGLLQRDTGRTEVQQRERVRESVNRYFDSDDYSAGGYANVQAAGRTNLNGSETIDYSNPLFYDPDLQLNLLSDGNNLEHGDMVYGYYTPADRHDEGYNVNPYNRDDFIPETPGGAVVPADSTPAFMVRIRRTADYATAAHQDNQPGVSSAGPPVPALFARGSMAKAQDPGEASIRRDGLTVRATSIASAEKSTRLGPLIYFDPDTGELFPDPDLVAAIAIRNSWNLVAFTAAEYATLTPGTPRDYEIHEDGWLIRPGQLSPTDGGPERGRMIRVTTMANSDQPVVPGALSAVDTTFTVFTSEGFGPNAIDVPFLIRMDREIMQVTERNGNDWTVVRGYAGTTPVAHDSDALIIMHEASRLGDVMEKADRLNLPEELESEIGAELLVRVSGTETLPSASHSTFYHIRYLASTDGTNTPIDRIQFSMAPGTSFDFRGGNPPVVGPGSVDSNGNTLTNANVDFSQTNGQPSAQNIRFAAGINFGPGSILNLGMGTRDNIENGEAWDTYGDTRSSEIQVLAYIDNGTSPQPRNVYEFASSGAGSNTSIGVLVNSPRSRNPVSSALVDEEGRYYSPVYDQTNGDRLIGFGVADVVANPAAEFTITVTRQPSQVAPNNASATFGGDFNRRGLIMNDAEISDLFDARRGFVADPLLSPASVRAQSK